MRLNIFFIRLKITFWIFTNHLKQLEDAIKATKEGKPFNYSELTVPPGFHQIPLRDGRAITSISSAAPVVQNRAEPKAVVEKYDNIKVNEHEASDDLLNQLENELGDDFDDDGYVDPEEEKFNQQIKAAQSFIPKMKLPAG